MWNAKGRHGIHSPYVYDFLDNCRSIKRDDSFRNSLKNLYKTIRNSTEIITIEDFGVGSKKMNKQRKVSNLLKTSSSKGKFGTLLYQLTKHYKIENSLELGTSIGIGAIHLAKGNPLGNVITVEACSASRAVALTNFDRLNCSNIKSINNTFVDFFKTYSDNKFDLVYIDGHHDGIALLNYLHSVEPFTHDETIFLLDDIRWSQSMLDAWNQLKEDEKYHVSIDFFCMGMLVKRPYQRKENFTLKL